MDFMKRTLAALTLAAMMAVPVGLLHARGASASSAHSSRAAKACSTQGYTHAKCVVVPANGKFSISVPDTKVKLIGTGTSGTAGTEIIVAKVSAPCPGLHGSGFRVITNGPMPPLHLKKGTLYKFNPATGTCTRVSSVTGPGIYEAVGA